VPTVASGGGPRSTVGIPAGPLKRNACDQGQELISLLYILAGLLVIQGMFSLMEGMRFLSFVRRSIQQDPGDFRPPVAIIAPCKGGEIGLTENLRGLFNQTYPDYEIIFAISSDHDNARPIIDKLITDNPKRRARVVVAGFAAGRSEKLNNLLCALKSVSPECDAFAFVDSDARVRPDWLRSLVAPLADPRVGASSGYRWYLPLTKGYRGGFWTAILSAWNGSIATSLGDHGRNFAWGGSTAILRRTFERIGVRERWARAVSDDYTLTRAVKQSRLLVKFVPRCLVISREKVSLCELLEFTTRQVTITRVYDPARWWTGAVSHWLFNFGLYGGVAFALANQAKSLGLILVVVYTLGSVKGLMRLIAARLALAHARTEISRLWWMYCGLWPLVSVLFFWNFITSSVSRRIRWRGVTYEMRSSNETVVIRSEAATAQFAETGQAKAAD
jgi:ceramide glucosyltransferase